MDLGLVLDMILDLGLVVMADVVLVLALVLNLGLVLVLVLDLGLILVLVALVGAGLGRDPVLVWSWRHFVFIVRLARLRLVGLIETKMRD